MTPTHPSGNTDRILTIWNLVEADFPDKSTEFLMEMTCQRFRMQHGKYIGHDDVATALTKKTK